MAKGDATDAAYARIKPLLKAVDGEVMVELGVMLIAAGAIRLKAAHGIDKAAASADAACSTIGALWLDLLKIKGAMP